LDTFNGAKQHLLDLLLALERQVPDLLREALFAVDPTGALPILHAEIHVRRMVIVLLANHVSKT
jgi:hypothetical protein